MVDDFPNSLLLRLLPSILAIGGGYNISIESFCYYTFITFITLT